MSTATPPLLDLESLLSPIAGDSPSGESLTYAPEYDELRGARRSEEEIDPNDPWHRPTKSADWERVIELGTECLQDRSKDLQIAAPDI